MTQESSDHFVFKSSIPFHKRLVYVVGIFVSIPKSKIPIPRTPCEDIISYTKQIKQTWGSQCCLLSLNPLLSQRLVMSIGLECEGEASEERKMAGITNAGESRHLDP